MHKRHTKKKPGAKKKLETESGGEGGGLQNSFPEKRKLFNTTFSLIGWATKTLVGSD